MALEPMAKADSSGFTGCLAWMYAINTAGGEQVGIVDASAAWPPGVPHGDFHLIDSRVLFLSDYAADGTWLGVTRDDHPAAVRAACAVRDICLDLRSRGRRSSAHTPPSRPGC